MAARGIPAAERLPASSLAGSARPQRLPPVPRDPTYTSRQEPQPSTLQPPAADAGSLTRRKTSPKALTRCARAGVGPGMCPGHPASCLPCSSPRTGRPGHGQWLQHQEHAGLPGEWHVPCTQRPGISPCPGHSTSPGGVFVACLLLLKGEAATALLEITLLYR